VTKRKRNDSMHIDYIVLTITRRDEAYAAPKIVPSTINEVFTGSVGWCCCLRVGRILGNSSENMQADFS